MRSLQTALLVVAVSLAGCGAPDVAPTLVPVDPGTDAGTDAGPAQGQGGVAGDAGPSSPPAPDAGMMTTPASEQLDFLNLTMSIGDTRTVVGPDGVQHLIFSSMTRQPVYARCAKDCGRRTGWTFTNLALPAGVTGFSFPSTVAVDGEGKLWAAFFVLGFFDGLQRDVLFQCLSGCEAATSWPSGVVSSGDRWMGGGELAVSPAGIAWLVWATASSTVVAFCSSDCTTGTAWQRFTLTGRSEARSVAVTSTGQPRLALVRSSSAFEGLEYWSCEQNCNVSSNWSGTTTYEAFSSPKPRLRLDAAGRPRILLNRGAVAGSPSALDDKLLFIWCDSGCGVAANWKAYSLGEKGDGRVSVDFALHNGAVAISVDRNAGAMSGNVLFRCSVDCMSSSPSWTVRSFDTVQSFTAFTPPTLPPNYTNGYWRVGRWSKVVFNPVRGTVGLNWINSAHGVSPMGKAEDGVELARIAELAL